MAEEAFSASALPERIYPEGTMLGQYRLESLTAFSSMGEIYSAVGLKDRQRCSIFVISAALFKGSPDIAARLLGKAQEACSFRHRNFAAVRETLSLPECRCVVTEPVEGTLLRGYVEKGEPLPLSPGKIIAELAKLLAAAEKSPHIFPEFTPDNIFITAGGEVKLLYPALAGQLHLLSGNSCCQAPQILQNALFAAPEILLGTRKASFAASVYSLGAISYYITNGHPPFFEEKNLYASLARAISSGSDETEFAGSNELYRHLLVPEPLRENIRGSTLLALTGGAREGRTRHFLVFAVVLCCCLAGVVTVGIFKKRNRTAPELSSGARQTVTVKKAAPAQPPQKKILSASAGKASEAQKKAVLPEAKALHLAAKQLRSPYMAPKDPDIDGRIAYAQNRLGELENALNNALVDPRLMKLHKGRIEFRKRQFLALTARKKYLERKKEKLSVSAASLPVNRDLRQEVEGYFRPCRETGHFLRYRTLIATGKAQPFPVEKLKKRNVDLNMRFDFSVVPDSAAAVHLSPQKRMTTLALLMLNGFLMPVPEALRQLTDARAFLEGVPLALLHFLLTGNDPAEPQLRYLTREISWERFSLSEIHKFWLASLAAPGGRVLTEELLLLGTPAPPQFFSRVIELNRTELLPLLLQSEVDMEEKDRNGQTPLQQALAKGQQLFVRALLEAGAVPQGTQTVSSGRKR